jgi:hypothetical protein
MQRVPHDPQWAGLLGRSTHPACAPQYVAPWLHTHWPVLHVPSAQMEPHWPQLLGSVSTAAQPVGQWICWAAHLHTPAVHVPAPQGAPHWPQLLGSVVRSAQPMPGPQSIWLGPHWHMPEVHVPLPHFLLHVPQ